MNGALQFMELGLDRRDQLAELNFEGLAVGRPLSSALDKLCAEGLHDGVELADRLAAELLHPIGAHLQLNDAILEVLQVSGLRHEAAVEVIDKLLKLGVLLAECGLHIGCQIGGGPLHVGTPVVQLLREAWKGGRIKDLQVLASWRGHHDAKQKFCESGCCASMWRVCCI